MSDNIPGLNLFMMCEKVNQSALTDMPAGISLRLCRRDELPVWKAMPFDDPALAAEYDGFMTDYFERVYGGFSGRFFDTCLFACDETGTPVGTCFAWTVHGALTTLHWFKVARSHEGRGIGRALLSAVMRGIPSEAYPVYLHTHPGSLRAIKLYADFGFCLLTDPLVGSRENGLDAALSYLRENMPAGAFASLAFRAAPAEFLSAVPPGPEAF